jgi:hypothetical protein
MVISMHTEPPHIKVVIFCFKQLSLEEIKIAENFYTYPLIYCIWS